MQTASLGIIMFHNLRVDVLGARRDTSDRLSRLDDVDALMAAQGQQMFAISRDDQNGARCDSSGNDLIVIDIADHHTRHGDGFDQFDGVDLIGQHRTGGHVDQGQPLGG